MNAGIRLSLLLLVGLAQAANYASHTPMRPLPANFGRPLPSDASLYFVDPEFGDDTNDSAAKPWKTVGYAVQMLRPGDTLVLKGGIYHEHVKINARGTKEKPLTIRSAPGELAILDGGLPEFFDSPETAWTPVKSGAPNEFVSTQIYPNFGEKDGQTNLLGAFGDSMIPLHGYRFLTDLRSSNEYFLATSGGKTEAEKHIYCGPGLWYNPEAERIHLRLSHTDQTCLESTADNYRGETDARKLPLIVARRGQSTLQLQDASNIILQDLVVRGSRDATLNIVDSSAIQLDGVTACGGAAAMRVESTTGLSCTDCAFRGIAAPWTWRGSLKYRAIEAKIIAASSWQPSARPNSGFQFLRCEFTDCVDGVFIGGVDGVRFQFCFMDNISDDGFYLTTNTALDGTTIDGSATFASNRFSRCLTTFAFGVGHGRQRTISEDGDKQLGGMNQISGNVFDFRRPVHYQQPAEGDPNIVTFGRVLGDHGSPAWEPMAFSNNQFICAVAPWRNYYGAGMAKGMGKGTNRSVSKNVFYHLTGMPGQVLPPEDTDFDYKDNTHWSAEFGEAGQESWKLDEAYEKPNFTINANWREPLQLSFVPSRVGVRGRLDQFGGKHPPLQSTLDFEPEPKPEPRPSRPGGVRVGRIQPPPLASKRAAIVMGYPAFDAPIVEFILEKAGCEVDLFDKVWLPVGEYPNYDIIVITGDSVRAKMEPSGLAEGEHSKVRAFMEDGGRLFLMRGNARQFYPGEKGRTELESITGSLPRGTPYNPGLMPDHPWLEPLKDLKVAEQASAAAEDPLAALDRDPLEKKPESKTEEAEDSAFDPLAWLTAKNLTPLPMPKAENAIASDRGMSILGRVKVGEGS
ncbi:MAG: hypothetical protein AAF585_01535, partial [Verrucomicrobiota bacterium]